MKVNLEIVKKMGSGVTFTKMETFIKDNGLITKSMEMEPKLIQTNKNTQENISKIKNLVKEYSFTIMVINTRGSF